MNKKLNKILLLAIISCIFISDSKAFAAEKSFIETPQNKVEIYGEEENINSVRSNPLLSACEIGIGITSNGLSISFDTTATQRADEIGVKNVVLQEKTWYGGWRDIQMSNYYTNNSDWYAIDIVYTGATKGTTYRVKCTHYAKFGSTELTLDNTSSELVYN